jgi:WD domain, G-beta repeat
MSRAAAELFPQFPSVATLDDFELSVVVHETQGLRPDTLITALETRVHVVSRTSGQYLQVVAAPKKGKKGRSDTDTDHDGGEGSTGGNVPLCVRTPAKAPNNDFEARWDYEHVVRGEKYERFLTKDTLVLVELCTSMKGGGDEEAAGPLIRVAWGFVSLVADQTGHARTERRFRVQLYKVEKKQKISVDDLQEPSYRGQPPFVYSLWIQNFGLNPDPSRRRLRIGGPPRLKPYRGTVWLSIRGRVAHNRLKKVVGVNVLEPGGDTLAGVAENRENETKGAEPKAERRKRPPAEKKARRVKAPSPGATQRAQFALEAESVIDPGAGGCFSLQFSPDGRFLCAACADSVLHPIRVYDATTGALEHEFVGHHDLTYEVSWSHDGQEIISASNDGTAKIWSWQQRPKEDAVAVLQHPVFVFSAKFCPLDRGWAVTGSFDGTVRVWDCLSQNSNKMLMFEANASSTADGISRVDFDKSGTKVFTADANGEIRVWAVKRETVGADRKSLFKTLNADDMAPHAAESQKLVLHCLEIVDHFRGNPISEMILLRAEGRELFVQQRVNSSMCLFDARFFKPTSTFVLDNIPGVGKFVNKEWPLRAGVSPTLRGPPPAAGATGSDAVASGVLVLAGTETGHLVLFSSATKMPLCGFLASDLGLHEGSPPSCVAWNPKVVDQVAVCGFGMEQVISIAKLELPANISDALRHADGRRLGMADVTKSLLATMGGTSPAPMMQTSVTLTETSTYSAPPPMLTTDSPPLSPRSRAVKNALDRTQNPQLAATDRYTPEERLARLSTLPTPSAMPVEASPAPSRGEELITAREAYASMPLRSQPMGSTGLSSGAGWDAAQFKTVGAAPGSGGLEDDPDDEEYRRKQRKYRKKRREAMLSRMHTLEAYDRQQDSD